MRRMLRARRPNPFPKQSPDFSFKNLPLITNYLTGSGKIIPSRNSGLSFQDQRKLAKAVKHARHLALIPFVNQQ